MIADVLQNTFDAESHYFNNENYWHFYGLRYDPFAIYSLVPKSFLLPHWEQQFDFINHFCHTTNELLVITSEHGSGKSTFIKLFNQELINSFHICELSAAEITPQTLILAMRKQFSLPEPTGDSLLELLDSNLANIQHCSEPCLILIDDAENLSKEIFNLFFYLIQHQSDTQMRLHIVFLGTPSIKEKFSGFLKESGGDELIHKIELDPFSLEDTNSYLNYYLLQAGLPAASPFSDEDVARIHKLSNGLPAEINRLAKLILIKKTNNELVGRISKLLQKFKTKVIGGGILLIFLIGIAAFFSSYSHSPTLPHIPLPHSAKLLSVPVVATAKPTITVAHSEVKLLPVSDPSIKTVVASKTVAEAPLIIISSQSLQQKPDILTASVNESKQVVAKTETPKEKEIPKKIEKLTANKKIAKIKNNVTAQLSIGKTQNFTLQLIGLSDENAMNKFIDKNNLAKHAKYYHSHLNGKNWYVLLYGEYSNAEDAKAAINKLPPAVQQEHPWVRTIANVQLSIRRARGLTNAKVTK